MRFLRRYKARWNLEHDIDVLMYADPVFYSNGSVMHHVIKSFIESRHRDIMIEYRHHTDDIEVATQELRSMFFVQGLILVDESLENINKYST